MDKTFTNLRLDYLQTVNENNTTLFLPPLKNDQIPE